MASAKNSCKTAAVMNLLSKGPTGRRDIGAFKEDEVYMGSPREPSASGSRGERRRSGADELSTEGEASERSLGRRVSDSGTMPPREQIEYIDIAQMDDDPCNFYEMSGLEELAANIELVGLQQPLRVRPGAEDGRYVIVSGHRRRAAVAKLVEDGRGELRELPCIVERREESAALRELRLIYANSGTRKLTAADIGRQAERVEALLYQLKEDGYEFPGRMRDYVAEACKVSRSKLARLEVIRKNLEPSWHAGFETGKLAEATAYALAQMPRERQRVIYNGLVKQGEYPNAIMEHVVKQYGESLAQAEAVQCASYGSGPCLNREAMQARIMGRDYYQYNDCRQCCDGCPNLTHCKYACPMLADKIKEIKADAKARRQREQQEVEERLRPQVERIDALWARFGEARAASGKTMEECLDAMGANYRVEETARDFERLERREGKRTESTHLPYGYSCFLGEVQKYINLADLLGVSLDYLLCRTDSPAGMTAQPEGQLVISGWMPSGTAPFQPSDVVADIDSGSWGVERHPCRFDGKFFRDEDGEIVEGAIIRWMALPPVSGDVPESGTGAGVNRA